MEIIDNSKEFKDKLDHLWNEILQRLDSKCSSYESLHRGYAIEREVKKNSILFVGMNPSFSAKAWNNGKDDSSVFYDIPKSSEKKDSNTFFRTILNFYEEINGYKPPFAHHDLLFVRATNQKAVLEWMEEPLMNDFFKGQLDISKSIIESTSPVLIVVLNAGASNLFRKLFADNRPFCEELGAYLYIINGKRTPVLFSGMLSGQRALDLGSKESLKWHIKYILRQIQYVL